MICCLPRCAAVLSCLRGCGQMRGTMQVLLPRKPEFRFETQLRRQSDISRETSVGSWSLTNSLSFIQPMCYASFLCFQIHFKSYSSILNRPNMLIILLHFSVVELFSPLPPLASSSLVLVRLTVANPPSSPYWKQTKEGGESLEEFQSTLPSLLR